MMLDVVFFCHCSTLRRADLSVLPREAQKQYVILRGKDQSALSAQAKALKPAAVATAAFAESKSKVKPKYRYDVDEEEYKEIKPAKATSLPKLEKQPPPFVPSDEVALRSSSLTCDPFLLMRDPFDCSDLPRTDSSAPAHPERRGCAAPNQTVPHGVNVADRLVPVSSFGDGHS